MPGHRAPAPLGGRIVRGLSATAAALVLACCLYPAAAGAGSKRGASVHFTRNATTAFDPYVSDSTPAQQQWMRKHYDSVRAYPPFFDQALGWSPPAHFYSDLYAIYAGSGESLINQHPDWVLRDGNGNRLYIPSGCGGGSCPQYAADVGNPGWRTHWIDQARTQVLKGYDGIFIDDVNLELRVGNGDGDVVRPIDPRTGQPMTDQNWARYVAEFTEEIRNAFPGVEIAHNSVWWTSHKSPFLKRQVAAADTLEIERSFSDPNLNTSTYRQLLRHVDWLHARRKSIILEPYISTGRGARYELASYFLVRRRGDSLASDFRSNPPSGQAGGWWQGWDTRLGRAHGRRHNKHGVWTRSYARGTAVVNPPGAGARSIRFKRAHRNLAGKKARRFRLDGGEGDVYLRSR